jgi:enamine deaminase RidA (YjgF/YER057c/UK114 family)
MTDKKLISSGSPFEKSASYSRAIRQGDFVHVSGTTGYDYATMTMPDDVKEQTRNCLATIEKFLKEGDATLADVVRARYYVTSRDYVTPVFEVLGEVFDGINPTATMIVCELVNDDMKVEIEVMAQTA